MLLSLSTEMRAEQGFLDDFNGNALDRAKWLVAHRNWGGKLPDGTDYNGGVVPEAVSVSEGMLRLRVHGDRYQGPVRGIGSDRSSRPTGQRVGGAIATRRYFGPGRYEARIKIAPVLGAASAMWTFYYREAAGGQIVNHEIDIELPGRPTAEHRDPSFDHALFSARLTEEDNAATTVYKRLARTLADGEFHIYRFDWITDAATGPKIEYRIDGVLHATITSHVPFISGRLWLGAWFPRYWAGKPDFAEAEMLVDWVRITPGLGRATEVPEDFAGVGWAKD